MNTTLPKTGFVKRYANKAVDIITRPVSKKVTYDSGWVNPKPVDHKKEKAKRDLKARQIARGKKAPAFDYLPNRDY